jgi:hypothetical protein
VLQSFLHVQILSSTLIQNMYCDVVSKWKNYHIITFPGQSLSKTMEEAMDLSQDRLILELDVHRHACRSSRKAFRIPVPIVQ